MTSCQGCGTDIIGKDRFCRNCGAPVATSVGDWVDTSRFSPAGPAMATVEPGARLPTNPLYAPPPGGYPVAQGVPPQYRTAAFLRGLVQHNYLWIIFLLFISLAVSVGVGAYLFSRPGLAPVEAFSGDREEEAAQTRQAYEEAVQNALGFKKGSMSDAEFPDVKGIFVNSLMSDDSAAALARVQAGDVMMELNDQAVRNDSELALVLNTLTTGQEVGVKLYRDGDVISTRMKIADRSFPPLQPKVEDRDQGFLGIKDSSRRCCIPGTKKFGVEVHETHYNAPAELFGLQQGDVITHFNGNAVRTPSEFNRRIRAAKPRSKVTLKFYRGGTEQTAELIMGHRW